MTRTTTLVVTLLALVATVGLPAGAPLAPVPAAAVPWWQPIIGADGLDQIVVDETRVVGGWTYTRYVDLGSPCSLAGHQSFVIGRKVGASTTATAPLWLRMRGGGAGWFDEDGDPQPTAGNKSEESFTTQLGFDSPGLMADVKAEVDPLRVLIVSMCSHDLYGGIETPDPHNPAGAARPTTGLSSLVAALAYTTGQYPTDDYVLHGTSAGGVGTFHVAGALQLVGYPPTALVSDSGVANREWQLYVATLDLPADVCEKVTTERIEGIDGRLDPRVTDPANQPHLLVSSGRLTVPIAHVWNLNDPNVCGREMLADCPLPDGSTPSLRAARCNHAPLRLALTAPGADPRSIDMGLCVEGNDPTMRCDRHVVTTGDTLVNDPSMNEWPADYQAVLLDWVVARLADD